MLVYNKKRYCDKQTKNIPKINFLILLLEQNLRKTCVINLNLIYKLCILIFHISLLLIFYFELSNLFNEKITTE